MGVVLKKEVTFEIKKPLNIIIIGLLLFVLYKELMVTTSTPINFGDEGFHTRIAQWMAEEKEIPRYIEFEGSDIEKGGFSTTPVWHLLEGSLFLIFGINELVPKLLTPFISVMTGLLVFVLVKKIFNETASFISTVLIISAPAIVTYSVLFYTDTLFTFYLTLFFLTITLFLKNNDKKYILLASIFGSLSVLTKAPGFIVYPLFGLIFIYQFFFDKKNFDFKNYLIAGVIILLITSTFFLRNLAIYNNPTCRFDLGTIGENKCRIDDFENQYKYKERTVNQGTESNVLNLGLLNYLNFAYGNIWLIVFGFISGVILLFTKKMGKVNAAFLIIFIVMAVFIIPRSTGRAEDTSRYTLGWLPIICIIAGVYFAEIAEFIKSYQKYLPIAVMIIVVFFAYKNFDEKIRMMPAVKNFSPSFFEACDFVKNNLDKDAKLMTVWVHRAVFNCQRDGFGNLADISLSRDLDYTINVAKQHEITHIFIQKFSLSQEELEERYSLEFIQFLEENPDNFVNVFENGPSLEQCLTQGVCDGNIIYEIKG